MELNTPEFKQGLRDMLLANPEILQPVVEELFEDYMLGKLMHEQEKEELANFDEVMAFLDAHRSKK